MSESRSPPPQNPVRAPQAGGATSSFVRSVVVGAVAASAVAGLAVVAGFWWFVWSVPTEEVRLNGSADGIVVLTGGSSRVADAIELLSEGRGKRLLITGVHRA